MHLLVSVSDAAECAAALAGGADIIDAKDPARGALGPVSLATFRDIVRAAGAGRSVSAALGDADGPDTLETAGHFAAAGAAFVKAAVHPSSGPTVNRALLQGLVDRARAASASHGPKCYVVAVAYADQTQPAFLDEVVTLAAQSGCTGVLLDTGNKQAGGLCRLLTAAFLAQWLRRTSAATLTTALAGGLTSGDLTQIAAIEPDIAGVRGAACVGGRTGRVDEERVRALKALLAAPTRSSTHCASGSDYRRGPEALHEG